MQAVISRMRLRGIAGMGLGMLPVLVQAATPPAAPTAGSVGDTLKRPPSLQQPAPAAQITTPAPAQPAAPAGGATLTVSEFRFSGNTVFSAQELSGLISSYLNRPISLGELDEAADKVAEFYAAHGYSLASVTVPAQKIKDHVVDLLVIEGRIGGIGFEGNHGYDRETLQGFMPRTHIGDIYRADALQDDLQNLNGLPGLAARAILKPGADYGTSDVVVKVQEDPLDATLSEDNYGRKDIGEYRVTGTITLNNPAGVGDQLSVLGTHSNTNQLNYGYVDYNVPVSEGGLRLDANYGYARFRAAFAGLTEGGKNANTQLGLVVPWQRSTANTFSTTFAYVNTRADADQITGSAISNTDVNLFKASTTFSHSGNGGAISQLTFDLRSNFRKETAEQFLPPVNQRNHEQLRLELDAQRLQPLPAKLQLLAHVDAAYSPQPMPDTEQLAIGGPTSVRGFAPSEARGDRGFYGQLTLRRPFVHEGLTLVPRVYEDYGLVTALSPAGHSTRELSSPGTGFDVLYHTLNFKIDWSYALVGKPESDGRSGGRVYASLTIGY